MDTEIICNVCTSEGLELVSPKDYVNQSPKFETKCTHRLCKGCWIKISQSKNRNCPYCREDLSFWFKEHLGLLFERSRGYNRTSQKDKYIRFLSGNSEIEKLYIEDEPGKDLTVYFFRKCEEVNTQRVLSFFERFRMISENHYIINEHYFNFSPEKIRFISRHISFDNEEGILCCCGKQIKKNEFPKHVYSNYHKQFLEFFIEENFGKYAKIFAKIPMPGQFF